MALNNLWLLENVVSARIEIKTYEKLFSVRKGGDLIAGIKGLTALLINGKIHFNSDAAHIISNFYTTITVLRTKFKFLGL